MWQFLASKPEENSPIANVSNWSLQTLGVATTLTTPVAIRETVEPQVPLMFVASEQPALAAIYFSKTPLWVWFPADLFNYTLTAPTVSEDGSIVCATWPLRSTEAVAAGARSFVSCHNATSGGLLFVSRPSSVGEFLTTPSIDKDNNVYIGTSAGAVDSFGPAGTLRYSVAATRTASLVASPVLLYPDQALGFVYTGDCIVRAFNLTTGVVFDPVADVSRWCTGVTPSLSPSNKATSFLSLRTPGAVNKEEGPLLVATPDWLIALPLSPLLRNSVGASSTEWPVSWYVRTSYCQIASATFIVDQLNVYYTACERAGSVLNYYFEVFPLPDGSNWPVLPTRHPVSPALQYGLGIGIPLTAIILLVASFLYCTRSTRDSANKTDRRPLMSTRV